MSGAATLPAREAVERALDRVKRAGADEADALLAEARNRTASNGARRTA